MNIRHSTDLVLPSAIRRRIEALRALRYHAAAVKPAGPARRIRRKGARHAHPRH